MESRGPETIFIFFFFQGNSYLIGRSNTWSNGISQPERSQQTLYRFLFSNNYKLAALHSGQTYSGVITLTLTLADWYRRFLSREWCVYLCIPLARLLVIPIAFQNVVLSIMLHFCLRCVPRDGHTMRCFLINHCVISMCFPLLSYIFALVNGLKSTP